MTILRTILPMALALLGAGAAPAHDGDHPDAGPAVPPLEIPAATDEDADAPPSLDELLGIETDADETSGAEIAEQEAADELSRRLQEEPIATGFAVAIQKMMISADQLDRRFDTGLGTQRIQEEILARLDHLIDQAKKQQNQGGSSQSSPSSSRSQQEQQQQAQQPGQRPDQAQPGQQREGPSSDSRGGDPPAPRQADPNTVLDESRSEWGTLPQRVRDMLLQGRTEKYSSLYEQLTREYYQRLAEEGS